MGKIAFQCIFYSIVVISLLDLSEGYYADSYVSCSVGSNIVYCHINAYNSTVLNNALKICTFGKHYTEVYLDFNISERSIELPLELGDNVTNFYMYNFGSSPLFISILPLKNHPNISYILFHRSILETSFKNSLFSNFPNLKTIEFGGVYFVEMLDDFLTGFTSLSRIGWSGGSLVNISENAFEGLTSLSYIDLSYNSISYLPSQAFQNLPSLRILDVRGNPLNCSTCGLQWMSMVDPFNISIDGDCTDSNTRLDSIASHSHCHTTESYQCFNKSIKCENTCINTPLSYICTCDEGYGLSLKETEQTCYDIDECLHDVTLCEGMKCRNTLGSYECYCEEGFYVEANSCLDVDECSSNPCEYACSNTVGSYQCAPYNFQFTNTDPTLSSLTIITFIVVSCFEAILLVFCYIFIFVACCYFKKYSQTLPSKNVLSPTAEEREHIEVSTLKSSNEQGAHNHTDDDEVIPLIENPNYCQFKD